MSEAAYFDTPERAERAQLLVHLVNNTQDVLYLRGPTGAGKTRFVKQLLTDLEPDYELAWGSAGKGDSIPPAASVSRSPATGDVELDLLVQEEEDRRVIRVIDDADALGPEEIEALWHLYRSGERIILLGTGGPVQGLGEMRLQFVDIPPFSEEQSREFIRLQGKLGDGALDERMVLSLHRAAGGQPGRLLEALAGLPAAGKKPPAGNKPPARVGTIDWKWIVLAAVLVIVLGTVLLLQDRINAWFLPGADTGSVATMPAIEAGPEQPDGPFRSGIVEVEPGTEDPRIREMAGGDTTEPDLPPDMEPPAERSPEGASKAALATSDTLTEDRQADPILDAVIDAAISAAEQAPGAENGGALSTGDELQQEKTKERLAAPVKIIPPEPAAIASVPTVANPEPPEPKRPGAIATQTGQAWLRTQPAGNYTLQLVGSRNRASIDRFIRQHGLSGPYAVFSRDLDGLPWYSLVSGSYPDRDAAIAARKRLPAGISGVWPRTFASIGGQAKGR